MDKRLWGTSSSAGPKGEPGAYGGSTELELVGHIICAFEEAIDSRECIPMEDGLNHLRPVDGWALIQALTALKNYEALLSQPLFQLIPPGFYHTSHCRKTVNGVV